MELKKEDYGYNLIYRKRQVLNRYIYSIIFFFSLIITTLICFKRIKVFIKMYQSFTSFFKIFGLEFYFICLILVILYLFFIFGYIIYKEVKNDEWLYDIEYIQDKLDIFTFIIKCISVILFIMIFFFNPCTVSGRSMNDTFESGKMKVEDDTVNDWNQVGWGRITFDKGFEYSSNVGIAHLM